MDRTKLYGTKLHEEFDLIMSLSFTPDELAYSESIARATVAGLVKRGDVKLVSLAKPSDGHQDTDGAS